MRQFAYIGDHDAVTLWGITFPRGVAVSVSDEHALMKLAGNNHFAELFDGVEVMSAPVENVKKRGRPPKVK